MGHVKINIAEGKGERGRVRERERERDPLVFLFPEGGAGLVERLPEDILVPRVAEEAGDWSTEVSLLGRIRPLLEYSVRRERERGGGGDGGRKGRGGE